MPLLIMIIIIVLIRIPMRVHQHLTQVQELLPESDRRCPAGGNRVLFGYFPGPLEDLVKIRLHKLTLPLIVYPHINLVVDLPAPPVVVHRPHRHVLAIE